MGIDHPPCSLHPSDTVRWVHRGRSAGVIYPALFACPSDTVGHRHRGRSAGVNNPPLGVHPSDTVGCRHRDRSVLSLLPQLASDNDVRVRWPPIKSVIIGNMTAIVKTLDPSSFFHIHSGHETFQEATEVMMSALMASSQLAGCDASSQKVLAHAL